MKLFNRQKGGEADEPDFYEDPASEGPAIDWRRAAPRLVLAVLIVILLVIGVFKLTGVFGDDDKSTDKKTASSTSQTDKDKQTEEQKAKSGQSDTANTPKPEPAPTASTPAPAPSQAAPGANTGQLANSGPGETVAVFIVATAAGTMAYQTVLRRRLN